MKANFERKEFDDVDADDGEMLVYGVLATARSWSSTAIKAWRRSSVA